jgi:flagellar hook-associated protein 2
MSSAINGLNSSYISLINSVMSVESQPMTALTQKRDKATVQSSVYTDLKAMLSDLQSSVRAMKSTDAFYSMSDGRSVKVTPSVSTATVLNATSSSSAAVGSYNIAVTTLAKEQRVRSDRQAYYNQALNLTGSFLLGGTAARSQTTVSTNNSITGFNTSALVGTQKELGSGSYFVETRTGASGTWQFRVVDNNGKAQSVLTADGSTATNEWQTINAGTTFDTGRGLSITFGSDTSQYQTANFTTGAPSLTYAAQGSTINVTATDTLADIASAINNANYADGNKVSASIIDNQLFLINGKTGEGNTIQASDLSGGSVLSSLGILQSGAFKNVTQTASNAKFTINNMQIVRSSNSGLTDVLGGMTISLAADAEGKSATVDVASDTKSQQDQVSAFVTKFNKLIDYLSAKVAVTKVDDKTYTRGALADDSMFKTLRLDLVRQFSASYTTGGTYKAMNAIGLTLNSSFNASISDSTKLTNALSANRSDLTALLDKVMGTIDNTLSRFTGTGGYMSTVTTSIQGQIKSMTTQIDSMNKRLVARQNQLISQYGQLQAQLMTMQYQSQQFSAFYGSSSSYSSSG